MARCGPKAPLPIAIPIGFLLPVTITPSNFNIRRGDTLWLEASFSDSLIDKNSRSRYRVRPQDITFNSYINYSKLLGQNQLPIGVAGTFQLVEKVGNATIGGASSGLLRLVYDGSRYRAKIGIIPTTSGILSLGILVKPSGGTQALGNNLPFINLPLDAQGREQKAILDDSFYVINGGKANNFDLYNQNTRAFSLEPGTQSGQIIYEQQSTFTVEVK